MCARGLNKHAMYNKCQSGIHASPWGVSCAAAVKSCTREQLAVHTLEASDATQLEIKSSPLFCSFCCWYSVEYQICSCIQECFWSGYQYIFFTHSPWLYWLPAGSPCDLWSLQLLMLYKWDVGESVGESTTCTTVPFEWLNVRHPDI